MLLKFLQPKKSGTIPCSLYFNDFKQSNELTMIRICVEDNGHPLYYAFYAVEVTLFFDDLKLNKVTVRQYFYI